VLAPGAGETISVGPLRSTFFPTIHQDVMITIAPEKPVLIAGPTASGKSALALTIAERQGGIVVNADALQVFDGWRILTARPSQEDEARAPHRLYGHISHAASYSTGQWLREVANLLKSNERLIIVGGTGLNFRALTCGLAEIPPIPSDIRQAADQMPLAALIAELDPETAARIDLQNRMRVQRAWEVAVGTGKPLSQWQAETPAPLLALGETTALTLDAPKDWLTPRIAQRFDQMLAAGALDEAQAMLPDWDPQHLSAKAIGAAELIAHLKGTLTLTEAREAAIVATRQYAKRQRTWFRSKHRDWHIIPAQSTDLSATVHIPATK